MAVEGRKEAKEMKRMEDEALKSKKTRKIRIRKEPEVASNLVESSRDNCSKMRICLEGGEMQYLDDTKLGTEYLGQAPAVTTEGEGIIEESESK